MPAQCVRKAFDDGCKVGIWKHQQFRSIYHWHFENELIVCKTGALTVVLDGHSYTVGSGMCFFCRSEGVHYIEADADSDVICAQYDSSICGGTAKFWPAEPLFRDRYNAYARLEEIAAESESKERFYEDKMCASMSQLIVDIFRGEKLTGGTRSETRAMTRYRELMETIDSDYRKISFTKAASFMNMSEAYFSRFFKKTSGMTFSRYLNNVRVSKAIEIMDQQPDITMAALMSECGFSTLRNFNRVFKEVTGYAPTRLPSNFVLNVVAPADSDDPEDTDE